jgi:hypothetical protein
VFGRFRPNFDLAAAYPEVAAHRTAVRARDWAAARAIHDQATSWDLRQLLVHDTSRQSGVEEWLREILRRDRQDGVAATMLGTRLVVMGWEIRTDFRATHVSRRQFEGFHHHLRLAEEVLAEACAINDDAVTAWCERVVIARGLQLGAGEARRRYDEVTRRAPHFLPAQTQLLQQLCSKWGGSHEVMHAFARESAAAAPPGAHNAVLIVEAHAEQNAEDVGHVRREEVRAEIRAAGERSVFHPEFRQTPGWVRTLSTFALGYSLIGDWRAAKHCFSQLGPYGDDDNWWVVSWGSFTKQAFAQQRAKAMRKG